MLIGAKTEKQRFDLTIRFNEENATSGTKNMLGHIKSLTKILRLKQLNCSLNKEDSIRDRTFNLSL